MNTDAQSFWKWLEEACKTQIVVRMAYIINATDGHHNTVYHLFYGDSEGEIYHARYELRSRPEFKKAIKPAFCKLDEMGRVDFEEMCMIDRLDIWFERIPVSSINMFQSHTTFCSNGFRDREQLAILFTTIALTTQHLDPNGPPRPSILLDRLFGLKEKMRNDAVAKVKMIEDFAREFSAST